MMLPVALPVHSARNPCGTIAQAVAASAMSAFWGRAYPSSEESVMDNINDIIAAIEEPPETFEEYLTRYAAQVGTLVNSYIPQGSHPDMDRYLYQPLMAYSQNGGRRPPPPSAHLLRGLPCGGRRHGARHERGGRHRTFPYGGAYP